MVQLFCAAVGDGRIFPVEIDLDNSVGTLKKLVLEEIYDLVESPPSALALYLARRDDTWLNGHDDDMIAVASGEIPDAIKALMADKMWSFKKLSADEYFGKDFAPGDSDIHVLVQRALPSIRKLAEFVESPLPVKIGLNQTKLQSVKSVAGSTLCNSLFVHDEYAPCKDLWEKLFVRALMGAHVGHTQFSFITFWDSFIREPLMALFEGDSFSDRHASDSTSTEFKRPNLVFTLKDVCVIRGQEKMPGYSRPEIKLEENVLWCFGDVPYVFGSTAVGYECALFAIFSTDQKTAKTRFIAAYDTARVSERVEFVLALMQLSRLFPALVSLCPYTAKGEFKDIRRENYAVVRLNPTFVVRDFTKVPWLAELEDKYKQLEQLHIPHMEHWTKTSACGKKFTFEPRGFEEPPKTLYELSVAVRCVLEALVELHSHGWMHRNIQWPNVLWTRDEAPQWFLIDLADAARSPQQFPDGSHLNHRTHAPEIFVEGGEHTSAVDVWSIGYLIQKSLWGSWCDNQERYTF